MIPSTISAFCIAGNAGSDITRVVRSGWGTAMKNQEDVGPAEMNFLELRDRNIVIHAQQKATERREKEQ